MPVSIHCPNPECRRQFQLADNLAGRTVRCSKCKTQFTVPAPSGGEAPIPAAVAAPAEQIQAAAPPKPAPAAPSGEPPATIGRFQVRARLGAGGFGTVYRAYDPRLERDIALKVPQAGILSNPQRVERFLREAKAAAQLRHPNIVPIYDAGMDDGRHYIASAFVEGKPLSDAVEEKGMEPARSARIVGALAEALAYAHALGIVHRDVKPANVMLDAEDQPHLMDFGLAARQDSTEKLTHEGAVLGTPAYMAPEQAAGQQGEAKPESDQFSLGVVLYELLCGRTPFEGPPQIVLYNVLNNEPPAPRTLRKDIPLDLETICLKAMARRGEDRYADCQALADDLRRWQEGEPIRARRLGLGERLVRWCQREPRLALAGAVTGLSLLLVAVLLALLASHLSSVAAGERQDKEQALKERLEAEALLDGEKTDHLETRRTLYLRLILLARVQIDANDLAAALRTLNRCPAEFRGWEWQHLRLSSEGLLASVKQLRGHNPGVVAMGFSADSLRLACLTNQGTMKLWDVLTPQELRAFRVQGVDWGSRAVISADGSRLATFDGGPRRMAPPPGPGGPPPQPQNPPAVVVWDAQTGKKIRAFKVGQAARVFLALNANGQRLAIAGEWMAQAEVKIWDVQTGKEIRAFDQRPAGLRSLTFSPDGQRLAWVCSSGTKRVQELIPETRTKQVDGKPVQYTVNKPVFKEVPGDEMKVQIWDVQTGQEAVNLEGDLKDIGTVVFSPDGQRLAGLGGRMYAAVRKVTATEYKTVSETVKRQLPDGKIVEEIRTKTVPVTVEKEETYLAGSGMETLPVWDAKTGKILLTLKGLTGSISCLAISPDGQRLATAGWDPCSSGDDVKLWELRTGLPLVTLKNPIVRGNFTMLAFSPNGQHLAAAGSSSDTVIVWSARSGRLLLNYEGHAGAVTSLSFSPDGAQLASFSDCNRTVKVWEGKTGQDAYTWRNVNANSGGGCYGLSFSSDGNRLTRGSGCLGGGGCYGVHGGYGAYGAYGGGGAAMQMWNRSTGKEIVPPQEAGRVLGFSPDGTRFASIVSRYGVPAPMAPGEKPVEVQAPEVSVRDLGTGKGICTLSGLIDPVNCVTFSPDGQRLASFSRRSTTAYRDMVTERQIMEDGKPRTIKEVHKVPYTMFRGEVKVWDAQSGKAILTHADAAGILAFNLEGTLLASVSVSPMAMPMPLPAPVVTPRESAPAPLPDKPKEAPEKPLPAPPVKAPEKAQPVPPPPAPPPPPEVKIWDTRTGMELFSLKGHTGPINRVVFSPDGKTLVTVGADQVVKAWDVQTGKLLLTHEGASGILAFSKDGTRLASARGGAFPAPPASPAPQAIPVPGPAPARKALNEAKGFDLHANYLVSAADAPPPAAPAPPEKIIKPAEPVPVPKGGEPPLAPAGPEPVPGFVVPMPAVPPVEIKVWDLRTGQEKFTLWGHQGAIGTMVFSADGTRLASANWGHPSKGSYGGPMDCTPQTPAAATVKVWDMDTGRAILTFEGHTDHVNCMAFSPDGERLASGSDDKTVKIWSLTKIGRN